MWRCLYNGGPYCGCPHNKGPRILKTPICYKKMFRWLIHNLRSCSTLNQGMEGCAKKHVLTVSAGQRAQHSPKPHNENLQRGQESLPPTLPHPTEKSRSSKGEIGKYAIASRWVKDNIPFCGEAYLAHVRYGTDSENSLDRPLGKGGCRDVALKRPRDRASVNSNKDLGFHKVAPGLS